MTASPVFDPFALGETVDPYPVFAQFRLGEGFAHGLPPYPQLDGAIYLFNWDLIHKALKHPDLLQGPPGAYAKIRQELSQSSAFTHLSQSVLLSDPPEHGRLRRPMAGTFSRRHIETLESWLQDLADTLIQDCLAMQTFDLKTDFAMPFATGALSRITGLEIEDIAHLKQLTAALVLDLEIRTDPNSEDADSASRELREMIEERIDNRVKPAEPQLLDIMIDLVETGRWTREDVISNCMLLLFAGQETVIDTLGNIATTLDKEPRQRELLSSDEEVLGTAVEEFLRYCPPVHYSGARIAARDTDLGAIRLNEGDAVVSVLASANRDPAVYDDPEVLDITRQSKANVSFGNGLHTCLGTHLARSELRIALRALYQNHPNWTLSDTPPTARPGIIFRGYTSVPAMAVLS